MVVPFSFKVCCDCFHVVTPSHGDVRARPCSLALGPCAVLPSQLFLGCLWGTRGKPAVFQEHYPLWEVQEGEVLAPWWMGLRGAENWRCHWIVLDFPRVVPRLLWGRQGHQPLVPPSLSIHTPSAGGTITVLSPGAAKCSS